MELIVGSFEICLYAKKEEKKIKKENIHLEQLNF